MAQAGLFLAVAGAAISSSSQVAQGIAQERVLRRQARDEEKRGRFEASRVRRLSRRQRGTQLVGFAASGLDPGFGSSLDVLAETAEAFELEAQFALFESRTRAQDLRFAGDQARSQGFLGAITTVLGAASQGASLASAGAASGGGGGGGASTTAVAAGVGA